jgi:TetR/AcrR family transcriptional regulator, mexJK operon transcriptional repressor
MPSSSHHVTDREAAGPRPAHQGHPAKRQAIIRAATRVFLRNGFTNTSVDAIAAAAGVSKQTIYNHFGDKEQLFVWVIREAQHPLDTDASATLSDALADSTDLARDLRYLGRLMVRGILDPELTALRRLVIAELPRHPQLLAQWARPRSGLENSLARAIERQATRGVLDVPNPGLAARQLMLVLLTESLTRALYGLRGLSDDEVGTIVDDGVALWMGCYATRAPMPGGAGQSTAENGPIAP